VSTKKDQLLLSLLFKLKYSAGCTLNFFDVPYCRFSVFYSPSRALADDMSLTLSLKISCNRLCDVIRCDVII